MRLATVTGAHNLTELALPACGGLERVSTIPGSLFQLTQIHNRISPAAG